MKLSSQSLVSANAPVAGILLAGGASRRMGRAKALLPWGQSTLLQYLVQTLQPRIEPMIIVGEGKMAFPALPAEVRVIHDPIPHQGPLIGFMNGIAHAPSDRPIFLIGCDFPFVRPSLIDFLLEQFGESEAIVVQTQGVVQPLLGLYRPEIKPVLNQLVEDGTRSLTTLLKQIDTRIISEADWYRFDPTGIMMTNINTPEEYEQALQHFLNITS